MKKSIRFNFIDVLIIAVLVLAFAGVSVYMVNTGRVGSNKGNKGNTVFTVLLTEVDELYASAVTVGDFVRFGNYEADENNCGSIVNVKKENSMRHTANTLDGSYDNVPVDGRYDLVITVQGDGVLTNENLVIGTTKIRTGETFYGKVAGGKSGKGYKIDGYIIDAKFNE